MANLQIGFILMLVGMITVFAILLIVIYSSQFLISLLNKFSKPEKPAVDNSLRRVLEEAVSQITSGKGRIIDIKEL